MGNRISRNIVQTGQDGDSATELGDTNRATNRNTEEEDESSTENVEQDIGSSEPSTPLLNLSDPRPMTEARQMRTVTEDCIIEQYHNPTIENKTFTGNDNPEGLLPYTEEEEEEEVSTSNDNSEVNYSMAEELLPYTEEEEISTSNINREMNLMVQKLLPYLETDKISSISDLICEVADTAVLESDEHSRSIVFVHDKYKLSISVDTLVELHDRDSLFEVDVMLTGNKLPDLKGKSRKEILDILARGGGKAHKKLIKCLTQWGIEHIVSPYTKHIFVSNFTGETITKIAELIRKSQINLSISGGGTCEYLMLSDEQTEKLPSVSSGQEFQRKDATEKLPSVRTQEYQQKIANCHKDMQLIRDRNIKIGVIDTGCSHSLYEKLSASGTVFMSGKMISAEDGSSLGIETNYKDISHVEHGTCIVEIIANCVLPGTEIYVAVPGPSFNVSNIDCAIMALFIRDVNVLNCSFTATKSDNLSRTLEIIKSAVTPVIVLAAAGNHVNKKFIHDGLYDGSTIFVGSHNDKNCISVFSSAQCKANICSRGEEVYIESVKDHLREGTSFAAPHVTAAVANIFSFTSPLAADMIINLKLSAQGLKCNCKKHKDSEVNVNLKFDPTSFMFACFRNEPIDAESKIVQCCCFQNPKIFPKRLIRYKQ